ncbi:hypothetical protein BJX61DRAFT_539518 [Aspergillus egyptiacus]|nr:hypothetical protein BJX61DRAFT_539518 [Aspergillus egyptiacus]
MEPVSLAAGALAVIQRVKDIATFLPKTPKQKEEAPWTIFEELSVHASILQETTETMFKTLEQTPSSAVMALGLCNKSLASIEASAQWKSQVRPGDRQRKDVNIEHEAQVFMRNVVLFRTIVMDLITHKLLEHQHQSVSSAISSHKKQEEILNLLEALQAEKVSPKGQLDIEELAARLRTEITKHQTPWLPTESDPFSFTATIMNTLHDEAGRTICRGQLDSGCEDNWVSSELISRLGIMERVSQINEAARTSYIGFGGDSFVPAGTITLTWYASNSASTKETAFFVHGHVPFDMVLGRKFIAEESVFVFHKPALALRQGKFSKDELLQIEQKAREKGANNEQISSVRRTADAAAREQMRQQRAASRSGSRINTATAKPTSQYRVLNEADGPQLGHPLTLEQHLRVARSFQSLAEQLSVHSTSDDHEAGGGKNADTSVS